MQHLRHKFELDANKMMLWVELLIAWASAAPLPRKIKYRMVESLGEQEQTIAFT